MNETNCYEKSIKMTLSFSLVLWAISTSQIVMSTTALSVIKWNKHVGEFEPILEPPPSNRETSSPTLPSTSPHSLQEKTHNFKGEPLRLTYFQEPDFIEFEDNNTKVSGVYGDMWTLLSEMLNFTLVVERSTDNSVGRSYDNGSYGGILKKATLNETDIIPKLEGILERSRAVSFTHCFWRNNIRTFAHAQWKHKRDWIFKQFSVETWCLVLISFVILSIGRSGMQRILTIYGRSTLQTSFLNHAFNTLAMLCNQGQTIDYKSTGLKVLTITISAFSWFILVGYSARLMYSLSYEIFAAPYQDLTSMYEQTSIRVVVRKGSFAHLAFTEPPSGTALESIVRANRLTVVSSLKELKDTICVKPQDYAFMESEDDVWTAHKGACDLHPAIAEGFNVPMTSGISKRVKDKESIDIGIMKLREFGITSTIRRRWFPSYFKEVGVRQADHLAIDLDQSALVLAILAIGVVTSVVICIAENIFFAVEGRKHNPRLPHQLLVTGQPPHIHRTPSRSTKESAGRLYFGELCNYPKPRPWISWRPCN